MYKEINQMAKLTKKQENLYLELVTLHHEMIKAKHFNKRDEFEDVIARIKEEVEEYAEVRD